MSNVNTLATAAELKQMIERAAKLPNSGICWSGGMVCKLITNSRDDLPRAAHTALVLMRALENVTAGVAGYVKAPLGVDEQPDLDKKQMAECLLLGEIARAAEEIVGADVRETRLYTCFACGKVGEWQEGWQAHYRKCTRKQDGPSYQYYDPEVDYVVCSEECRKNVEVTNGDQD